MKKTYYITTTLPYVNAKPHVGHALEFVRADVAARFKKALGYKIFFNTGTDEHGQKLYEVALSESMTPQEYVNKNVIFFKKLLPSLGILADVHFIRTTDDIHIRAAKELWQKVEHNGYIYKKKYRAKYCVGCELEKTDSDLVNSRCPEHPNKELQTIDEENYFFKFSAFQDKLIQLYKSRPDFVLPEIRFKEIRSFVESGLRDFSISRLKSKIPWGIDIPDDNDHVMYVWFDALTGYISSLGWPDNVETFNEYWVQGTPTQYCGQDNLRQQSAIWQAMLMAAELPNSYQIIINGFATGASGIKMSKTIGNVIDPMELIEHYGTEAFRYYVLRHIHPWDGSPITHELFHDAYNAHLVNGIGNTVSRLLALTEKYLDEVEIFDDQKLPAKWLEAMHAYRFDVACNIIWEEISSIDRSISETEPYKTTRTNLKKTVVYLNNCLNRLYKIGRMLEPLLPATASQILNAIQTNLKPKNMFERKIPLSASKI